MAVRFFMMQAHYRSTLDFSNDALDAADKGYKRLINAIVLLDKIKPSKKRNGNFDMAALQQRCYKAMDDDFNTPVLIAELFEAVRFINAAYDGKMGMDEAMIEELKSFMHVFVVNILGLKNDASEGSNNNTDELMQVIINLRNEAKKNKDFTTSDRIREDLQTIGIQLKDSKDGTLWNKI